VLVRGIRALTRSGSISQLQLENAVLRHQVKILRRTVRRPQLRDRDRAFLAAASRALSRDRWSAFMVRPQTLLRWHRQLVRRKWTYRRRSKRRLPSSDSRSASLFRRPRCRASHLQYRAFASIESPGHWPHRASLSLTPFRLPPGAQECRLRWETTPREPARRLENQGRCTIFRPWPLMLIGGLAVCRTSWNRVSRV
jgi:hypothetical protein